jgi:predicted ArsR family transcriptional regulator
MIALDDNPTRQKIVMLLKKADHMTVAELSRETAITPMAVRQHLMSLEKKGIIDYVTKKYGIGRPVFLYRLTEKARDSFPKAYDKFIFEILSSIEQTEGRKKLDKILKKRNELLLAEKKREVPDTGSIDEKISRLAEMLDNEGYMVELHENEETYSLMLYNCLMSALASDFPEVCDHELKLYRKLLGVDIVRTQCQKDGGPFCSYDIPKK